MAPEGRKVGSLKAAGAEPSDQMRDEQLQGVVARREAHFEVKMYKTPQLRSTFRS